MMQNDIFFPVLVGYSPKHWLEMYELRTPFNFLISECMFEVVTT